MDKLFLIGTTIVNILLRSKLNGDKSDSFVDVVNALRELGLQAYEAREVNRSFERIGDNIAASCEKILEHSKVKQERRDVIVEYVIEAYKKISLDSQNIFNYLSREEVLKKELIEANGGYEKEFDSEEKEIYERLLDHTSRFIVNASVSIPEFTSQGIKRLVGKMDELTEKIDKVIEQLETVNDLVEEKDERIRNFERYYRNTIVKKYSYIQLFGAGALEREFKKYQLEIAYVRLEVCEKDTEKIIDIEKLFKANKNVWISGEAGSGKTTLLQWFAVCSAGNTQELSGLRDTIPVLIELRKVSGEQLSLRELISAIMKDSSYTIPEGWIEELIETGRFVFLIDGFDEVEESKREKVLEWLKEIDGRNKCIKVFSARPQVKERPKFEKLLEVRILSMNRERIEKFVLYWHKAVLADQLKIDSDDVKSITCKLTQKIMQTESLFKLASNPLLCAMICALHYRNDMNLPANKRELYEECCKMLLEKRDLERDIQFHGIRLDYERKKIIIAQLAYWMMRNNYVEAERQEAINSIKRSISGMNIDVANDETIFQYLLERTGLLRESEVNKVDFVHRTFQEYLTAYEISREEDWGYLKGKIGEDTWEETIGMAVGYANKKIADDIIQSTLEKRIGNEDEKKFLFLAFTFLTGAVEVDDSLRKNIEMEAEALIPPVGMDCYNLAEVGDLVVPYLLYKKEYDVDERIGCIRTLRIISTEKSLSAAIGYLNNTITKWEIEELGKLFREFDEKVLLQYEIHLKVAQYLRDVNDCAVTIHDSFIRIINLLTKENDSSIFSNITELKIIDYEDSCFSGRKKRFPNVNKLQIEGDFYNVPILGEFSKLISLHIISENDEFSIYHLNRYNSIYGIEDFDIIWNYEDYISGADLKFLHSCKRIRLVPLNSNTEIYFSYFNKLPMLERLELGAEFVLDLEYGDLPNNIKELVIYVPIELKEYANDVRRELTIPVTIKCYEELLATVE